MSVIIAMTGLTAAQHDLSVTSNNIANVGTTGFHSSRADFGDIYAQSPYTVARTQTGQGTQLMSVTANFAQGAVEQTSNTLDLAIEGQGFFIKKSDIENGQAVYSRAGGFGLNEDGFVVDNMGNYLMSRQVAEDGQVLASSMGDLQPIQIPMMAGTPSATETMEMNVNFSSNPNGIGNQAAIPPIAPFNFMDDTTYAKSTPIEILDAEGQPRSAYAYFIQTEEPTPLNQETAFDMQLVVDGDIYAPNAATEVRFNEFGMPVAPITPFTFSRRLNSVCAITVSEAQDGDVVKNGHAYIAPGGDKHMIVTKRAGQFVLRLVDGDPVCFSRPSVDVLFNSLAKEASNKCAAAILTGMGKDGANGLLNIRQSGGATFAQDQDSCVVFGMPKAAQKIGATDNLIHLDFVADNLLRSTSSDRRNTGSTNATSTSFRR